MRLRTALEVGALFLVLLFAPKEALAQVHIGPLTPCTVTLQMPATYTGPLTGYRIYLDPPTTIVPNSTPPSGTVSGPNIPSTPPYVAAWGICANAPLMVPGPHSIAYSGVSGTTEGPASAVVPFVLDPPTSAGLPAPLAPVVR